MHLFSEKRALKYSNIASDIALNDIWLEKTYIFAVPSVFENFR